MCHFSIWSSLWVSSTAVAASPSGNTSAPSSKVTIALVRDQNRTDADKHININALAKKDKNQKNTAQQQEDWQ